MPLVLCIVGLALYPQLILKRTAPTVEQTVAKVRSGEAPEAKLAAKPDRPLHYKDWEPTLIEEP